MEVIACQSQWLFQSLKEIHKAVSAVNVCDAAARCQAADVDIDIAQVLRETVVERLNTQLGEISSIVEMLGGQTDFTHHDDMGSAPP
jgi:hypothetical protein